MVGQSTDQSIERQLIQNNALPDAPICWLLQGGITTPGRNQTSATELIKTNLLIARKAR